MYKKKSIISLMLVGILIFAVGCGNKTKDEAPVNVDKSPIVDNASDKETSKDDASDKETSKEEQPALDSVKVVDIKDLRTFVINVEDQKVDVVLLGTGLPFKTDEDNELDNFSKDNIASLKNEYVGKEFLSEVLGFDSTERPLVYLWTVDNVGKKDKLVNEILLGEGLITFVDFGDEVMLYKDAMQKAEKHAIDNGMGMWKDQRKDKK